MDLNNDNLIYENVKPDILINYSDLDTNQIMPVAVIYVRPETNILSIEKSIIQGVKSYADVVYMANLNGKLFIKDALILEHYSSQFRFAIFGKEEIEKYPEMIDRFEKYFKLKYNDANIIGSFEALLKLKINKQDLFNIYVKDKDILKLYGQTIKKIESYYILNYDIPAILEKYTPDSNIFVIVAKFKNTSITFKEINQSIIDEITKNRNMHLINVNNDKFDSMEWIERIKRTYHISSSHIMAMFDMLDFVFKNDKLRINFPDTPLGFLLMNKNISLRKLEHLKEFPIVYINDSKKKKLVNIIEEGIGKNINECLNIFNKIIWRLI